MVTSVLGTLGRYGKKVGPYLVMEILLPGGTLLALLLFLYQSRPAAFSAAPVQAPSAGYCLTAPHPTSTPEGGFISWTAAPGTGTMGFAAG